MAKKFFKLKVLHWVLIAIAAGIVCSLFFPVWAVRFFLTFNSIFGNFLGLFIPILIIGLIAPGIAELGKGAGRLLLITVALAYTSTVLVGLGTLFTCKATFPALLGDTILASETDIANTLTPFFTIEMPPFMSVTSALALSFVIGLAITGMESPTRLMFNIREMVYMVIRKVIVPCLPLFVFGIFLQIGAEGKVLPVLGLFGKVVLVILVLHVLVLVLQFCIAGGIASKNPFKALKNMLPAYVTALGTQSSAATIPVTLRCAKGLGVNERIADFTIPLCATIHLSCSVLKITACALAIVYTTGMDISMHTLIGFIFLLSVTMVAAPGVPGGAIMAALGVLAGCLGFTPDQQGLMIALYIALDSFGTAGNVTGDGAISLIVDRIWKGRTI